MKKFLIAITIWLFGFSVFSQIKSNEADTQLFVFPMKGDFIHYSLSHTMSNTKHDLKYYFNRDNSNFYKNFMKKYSDNTYSGSFFKGYTIFTINPPGIGGFGWMKLTFQTSKHLVEDRLLFNLLTIKKFKVLSQDFEAALKLEFYGDSSYTLCFTNFVITYYGNEGGVFKRETLDLEAVYNEIKQKQSLDGKMYDKSAKNLMEIDKYINEIDKLFYTELDKVIRMDN